MVTVSRSNAFQRNLLLSIGGVFLIFAICFCIYQYQREREYKIDILHARLQMYNYDIMQVLGEDGITSRQQFLGYVRQHPGLCEATSFEGSSCLRHRQAGTGAL